MGDFTSEAILGHLTQIFPGFASYWESEGDIYRSQDGSFTSCGIFLTFTSFVRERYDQFRPEAVNALARFLDECMQAPGSKLSDAAAICFLENLRDETFATDLRRHLGGMPLEYFSQFS